MRRKVTDDSRHQTKGEKFTYCHVGSAPDLHRLSNRVHETPGDTKVTKLELSVLTHEDVGGLDIWGERREKEEGGKIKGEEDERRKKDERRKTEEGGNGMERFLLCHELSQHYAYLCG